MKLIDPFGRQITYLRIAITKKCNLRCFYCYPKERQETNEENLLSAEEIVNVAVKATNLGIRKIRLTGGEPLLREDIIDIIERLAMNKNIKELCLTTNGTLLKKYAFELKRAGLGRINISLDSLKPKTFRKLTQKDKLNEVLEGIEVAKKLSFPIKINFVELKGINESEKEEFIKFCKKDGLKIQFIKKMDLALGKEEIDHSSSYDRPPDCRTCNKIRLTSDGFLSPCLFSNYSINIRKYIDTTEAIRLVVSRKPKDGCIPGPNRFMIDIGG